MAKVNVIAAMLIPAVSQMHAQTLLPYIARQGDRQSAHFKLNSRIGHLSTFIHLADQLIAPIQSEIFGEIQGRDKLSICCRTLPGIKFNIIKTMRLVTFKLVASDSPDNELSFGTKHEEIGHLSDGT